MKVRAGRFSGIARQPDDIAGVDLLADFYEPLRKVTV